MERLLQGTTPAAMSTVAKVQRASARLATLTNDAQQALRGECEFNTRSISALREQIEEMAAVVERSAELRHTQPEVEGELGLYKSRLRELQVMLIEIRQMLQTRRASVAVDHAQLSAVSQWTSAYRTTR